HASPMLKYRHSSGSDRDKRSTLDPTLCRREDLDLYAKQREFVEDPARYTLCEAGTKSGKTLGCAVWLLDNALRENDTMWWWVAPSYGQAMIAFELIVHGDRLNED